MGFQYCIPLRYLVHYNRVRLMESRESQAKWDLENLRSTGCKLRTSEMLRFREVCAAEGLTRYQAIRLFCRAVVANPHLITVIRGL